MRKTLLSVLALLCTFTMTLGLGTACDQTLGDSGVGGIETSLKEFFEGFKQDAKDFIEGVLNINLGSPSEEKLSITGRPEGDTVTITDTVNTLTLGCDEVDVTWASSDTAVATVENGVVTLHAAGSTVISVTKGEKTGEFILTVVDGRIPASATVTITGMPQNGEVQFANGSLQLSATCSDDSAVVWRSNNEAVATVDETGKVTLLSPGSVEIVAQKKGESSVYSVCTLNVVTPKASREDFTNAVVIGNYVVGEIECRDASNVLSPEIVYDETADNYYLKYSHAKADGNNKYMIYTFGGLEAGARYVLKYNMKVLSQEGAYNHQINLYSDKDIPVAINDPLVGNVYNWHTTGLDTETAKIYQSGSGALYRDGVRWTGSADSADDFHEYTLGFIAGESSVGFAFVGGNTYEVLFDYICVEKAPEVEEYTLTSTTRLPVGESYMLTPVAVEDIIYYQPFKLTYTSSDKTVATVNEKGVVTALKEGEVTITAKNEKGEEKTANITVVPAVDGTVYDIFYEETDPDVNGNHLYKEYELPETVALDAVQGDKYRVTLDIDAIYYVGNVEMYLGLLNTSGTLIGHNAWKCAEFPTSGEKKTISLEIELPWASGNFDVSKLQVYLRYGTEYQIGVDVVSIEKVIDPNAANYDLWYVGRTESVSQTYELTEVVTGGVQYNTVEVKLSLNLLEGTMPRIKFYLVNTDGTQITDPADNGWITVADCYEEATETYVFTTTFKWTTGNWNVGSLWLLVEDGSYRLGVDVVSVKVLEDPNAANYNLWYVGGAEAIEQTYELTEAVTGGAQYDTAEVKLSLDLVNGTMPRIKFYLFNTEGAQITDPADNGWITVAEGENTVTATFKWATGNWDIGSINVIAEDGTYRLGVDVVSVQVKADTTGENYDLWYVGGAEAIEQTYELTEAVTGGAQYDTAEVKLSLDLLNGTMPRIKFYLFNTEGAQITDPADNGWITVAEGENTVTATFKWATGNWDIGSINVIAEDGSYRLGVDVVSVNVKADTTGENYDLWYVGTTEAIEQTYELTEAVTGGAQYDTAEVKLSLDLLNGTMPRIKFYLFNTDGAQITDPAENGWITVTEGEITVTTTFKWATGNWDVGAIKVIAEDGSYRLGIDVKSVEIQETTYQLEYSVASGSQAQVFAFDTVAGGTQNGYVKVTFDVAVFYGTLKNIQFNLCTDTAGSTTVANSNKAWNEDGTKITSSGGQISMENCTGKKTVTVVTTFPWANGNWDLQSIRLQLYGTNLQAGISNIHVELLSDFTPAA